MLSINRKISAFLSNKSFKNIVNCIKSKKKIPPITINSINVLRNEEVNLPKFNFFSKKLDSGRIRVVKKIPNVNGIRKGAPKYIAAITKKQNNNILLIFLNLICPITILKILKEKDE
jgi:hypothetical protein